MANRDVFGESGFGYAGDLMTMRGPTGKRERRRLQPGMLLADGTIYTGSSQISGLKTLEAELEVEIKKLVAKLEETRAKIANLEEAVNDVEMVASPPAVKQKEPPPPPVEEKKPSAKKPKKAKTEQVKEDDSSPAPDSELHDDPGVQGA